MKKLFVLVVSALAIASIIAGKVHWDNKIEETAKVKVSAANVEIKEGTKEIKSDLVEKEREIKMEQILKLTKNLPEEIASKFEKAVEEEKPVHLVIFGSDTTMDETTGWSELLKKELINSYGENIIKVTIREIADTTSSTMVEEGLYQDIIDLKPDVVLYEPFILYDNGKIRFEERLENLETVLDEFQQELPKTTIILQPANPLLKAIHYPKEVEELQRFAEENEITYLNHWEAWPDHQTDEIAQYLTDDSQANESGQKLWADYLINYFVSK